MPPLPKLMVVASQGGHWVQLMRMRQAWKNLQVVYMSTDIHLEKTVKTVAQNEGNPPPKFIAITDANFSEKFNLIRQLLEVFFAILRHRPDVVITTGAAPGYFAVRFGKYFGARTIWIDSIANAENLSMSGERVGKYADLWLTQWEHLERPEGPRYIGAVL